VTHLQTRTPKVKEFVRKPFIDCPDCGSEKTFGVLMICDRRYVRRCIHCWFDQSFGLPAIKKRIIYLDQFVISNMMKELDASDPAMHGFYHGLFAKLDRLSKLQLIVCPDSPVHDHESVVDPRYEKIRAVFRHLSDGVSFHDPTTILHAEIMRAFNCWLDGISENTRVQRDFALTKNPDVWHPRYRIELNYIVPGLAKELRANRERVTTGLQKPCEQWRNDPKFNFKETFEAEVAAHGQVILHRFFQHLAHFAAVSSGQAPVDDEVCFPPQDASLVLNMSEKLRSSFPDRDERRRLQEFFASENFRAVFGVRISSLFWATIARTINAGRKTNPEASMFNDISAVAAYSRFCDAMFVDKEISHLAKQGELRDALQGNAVFFSLRKNETADFLSFLNGIEQTAPQEHLKLVEDVYGSDWPTPYVDLLNTRHNATTPQPR
jgi:hypothetical protein